MIFLDLETPDYISMRVQEHKVPNLIKTIRGKGTVENSNEFDTEERVHLNFTVTEKNLQQFLKIYSRFQTLCILPIFNDDLRHKIYDARLLYNKQVLKNFLQSIDDNDKAYDDIINNEFNRSSGFVPIKALKGLGLYVEPNANECLMVYLESFSFSSIQDSSDGYNLDLVLWVCDDLTFYNGDEVNFLEKYYSKFAEKLEAFKKIDEQIEILFKDDETYTKVSYLNLKFSNIYNDQEIYSTGKQIEKVETPTGINIPAKYITQVEVRAMNNLKRLPIVGKTKGFIQHMGKGEIGVTVKLVLNQKNALEENLIKEIRALSLFQQDYITLSESDFYLFKGMDIKELSLATNIIEEPSDDVDATVITLFFTGAGTNKKELENNYFHLMERENTMITLRLFNNYLNRIVEPTQIYYLKDYIEEVDAKYKNFEAKKYLEFYKSIISKNDLTDKKYEGQNGDTIISDKKDFKFKDLFHSYKQEKYIDYKTKKIEDTDNIKVTYTKSSYSFTGWIGEIVFYNGVPKDSFYTDDVLFRLQQLSHKMLNGYTKDITEDMRNNFFGELFEIDNNTQKEFLEKVFVYFLSEFFKVEFISNNTKMIIYAISNVFKIEIINNALQILKSILDEEFKKSNSVLNTSSMLVIDETGNLDSRIKIFIKNSVIKALETIYPILSTEEFKKKVLEFINYNYYFNSVQHSEFTSALDKAVKQEIDKFINRYFKVMEDIKNNSNGYVTEIIEMLIKLNILGERSDAIVADEYSLTVIDTTKVSYLFSDDIKVYTLSNILMSLLMIDLCYEDSVYGVIAVESAKNVVGPHVVTFTAIEETINQLTGQLKIKLNGSTDVNEYINDLEDGQEKEDLIQYMDILDRFKSIRAVYEITFGSENLNELLKLNKTFIRSSLDTQDFNKAHGVSVFSAFDSPMNFLKSISETTDKYKEVYKKSEKNLNEFSDKLNNMNIDEILTSNNPDKGLDVENIESAKEILDKVTTVFSSASQVADLTINKFKPADVSPSTFMQTELLGEMKLLRGLRSATRLVFNQYEKAMPNYEAFVIDEEYVKKAMGRGYDYLDKIYSISNIISINIKQEDISNLKFATIRIVNTSPIMIGLDTVLKESGILSDNKESEVIYNNKFKTNKIVFRSGMLINISLDRESQFFDFTGKIESVEVNSDIITLRCSSFASELLSENIDLDNVSATGFWGNLSKNKLGFFRRMKRTGQVIAHTSNIDFLNGHLIPEPFASGKVDDDRYYKYVLGGASGILYSAIQKSLSGLRHLDCPYNELLQGKDLSKNKDLAQGGLLGDHESFMSPSDTTSHRITENINAVDFDTSFYGLQAINVMRDKVLINTVSAKKDAVLQDFKVLFGHSSFIPKDVNNVEPIELKIYNSNNSFTFDSRKCDGHALGYCYSYRRKNVKLYDVLNDLTLRSPASYWDVFESGHYGTLFFGRSNYMVSRKNKISSLSKHDVERISELVYSCFDQEETLDKGYLNGIEFAQCLKYLSEMASVYDTNFSKDKTISDQIKSQKLRIARTKNIFFKDMSKLNEDFYNEESPVSDLILAMSGHNLISCNITTNEEYFNAVDIRYKPGLSDNMDRFLDFITFKANKIRLKTFENLPNSRLRVKAIDPSLTTDLHTSSQAFEYAQGVMFKELTNYYSGKIVILYCPNIKKNDEVLIIDSRNKISGFVVVKEFEHIVDVESGAITIITPGMKIKTSSMMNDIYLTGMVSKLQYEFLKKYDADYKLEELTKVNQIAESKLKEAYKEIFNSSYSVPFSFDYVGYNFKFDKKHFKSTEKQDSTITTEDGRENLSSGNIQLQEEPGSILTPRNISSLPFKLYPLIHNGKPLIPDSDIYNSVPKAFEAVTRLLLNIYYFSTTAFNVGVLANNLVAGLQNIWKEIAVTNRTPYQKIVDNYFAGFVKNMMFSEYEVNIFLERMLADNYDKFNVLDKDNIKINNLFLKRTGSVFFNCKALNQYEDERIRKIAKILCQFRIVHLVELDGRIMNEEEVIGFENNNFTVIKKLIEYMEDFNTNTIRKPFEDSNKWTCVLSERLIKEPVISKDDNGNEFAYDDIGAVLINLPEDKARSIFRYEKKHEISTKSDMQGGIEATRYLLKYHIHLKSNSTSIRTTNFLYHNFYGKELGRESLSYLARCELMDQVKNIIVKEHNYNGLYPIFLYGDFNLVIRDNSMVTNNMILPNAHNEFYDLNNMSLFSLIRTLMTTTGYKIYDSIISDSKESHSEAGTFNYNVNFDKAYSNDNTKVSDHYPVYLMFKKHLTI